VGIECAGNGGDFVKQEGATAMTKARAPAPTVAFSDDYCAHYQPVFPHVRQFEQFSRLELGLVAETKRKSLPRRAQATKADPQAFHHFLAKADWSVEAVHAIRLELTRQALRERPFILCSDETGDRKKGKTTDYAAHQYSGTGHTLANGVVSVHA
jgi:SRSO17 transposase